MTSRHAFWAALLAGALVACGGDAPAPRRAERSALGGAEIALGLGEAVLGDLLEATGLFEFLGLGGPDGWTKAKLNEISAKLDHLDADVAALSDQLSELEKIVQTLPARETITAAHVRFTTCYEHHLKPPAGPITDPAQLEEHNRALLARAYQVTGLPPPAGLFVQDEDCAILEKLEALQAAILPVGPGAARPLVKTAQLARQNGRPFDDVVAYFGWTVGVQRMGMAILAQAHHRLGRDAELANVLARARSSLRGQEIELLHAAEAYVAYQAYDGLFSGDALALADQVVARMEGTPWFVTSSTLFVSPSAGVTLSPPIIVQGGDPVPLDDVLAADPGILPAGDATAYSTQRRSLVYPENQPFPYVATLDPTAGVEVGWSRNVTIARYRTTRVSPGTQSVVFLPSLEPVPLQARNVATLEAEDASRDRLLLAHSAGAASPTSRFKLVPFPDDPRYVLLEVDQAARALTNVPIGPVAGTDHFAARPDVEGVALEMVPRGPAEPERFAFRLEDGRWLGTVASAPPTAGQPEPFAYVVPVNEPFYFDVVRGADGCEVSFVAADGVRRFLYVNEQIVSASRFEAHPASHPPVDLAQVPSVFSEGDPRHFCPAQYGQPYPRLSVDIRGGAEGAVTYTLGVFVPFLIIPGAWDPAGITCYLSNVTAPTTEMLFACRESSSAFPECWYPTGTRPGFENLYRVSRQILPGNVHRFWCEHDYFGGCYDFGWGEPGIAVGPQ